MPARDLFHEAVRNALIKAGWTVTHDPLHLKWQGKDLFVDLGAERLIAAELGNRKIAVEIKGFLGDEEFQIHLIGFDPGLEEIVEWMD